MSSTNKTPNVELSQFVYGVDKPTWLWDYNSDMLAIDSQLASKANVGDSGKIITLWTGSVGVGGTIPLDPSELPSVIIVGMASDTVAFELYRIGNGGFAGSSTYPQAGGNFRTMGVTLHVTGGVLTVFRSQSLDHIPSSNHNAGSQAVTVSSISVRL